MASGHSPPKRTACAVSSGANASDTTAASTHNGVSSSKATPQIKPALETTTKPIAAPSSNMVKLTSARGAVMALRRACSTAPPAAKKACALYSEWATRCSSARSYAPRPHCININPICAQVDQASMTFTLMRVIMTSAANAAVRLPTTTSKVCAPLTSAMKGLSRIIKNPPRFTIPACSKADTGVGASIT